MIVTDVKTSLELGEGIDIVEEYVNDAIEASNDEELLESYDKEWALKDQGRREGFEEGKLAGYSEIALSMLKKDMDINLISEITKLSIEEINNIKNEM